MRALNGLVVTITLIMAASACVHAGDTSRPSRPGDVNYQWPQWRGPNRDDVSKEVGLAKKWPKDGPERLWLFEDAGKGYSGPAIVDGVLYIMGTDKGGTEELLFALDADTGAKLWSAPIGKVLKNGWGDGPRGTASVDDGLVYALGGQGVLLCVDATNGKQVWKRDLVKDFDGRTPNWGYSESVLVDGDRVVCSPGGEEAAVVALDKKSGRTLWRAGDVEMRVHYSSIIRVEDPATYVKLTSSEVVGLNPENGQVRWRVDFPGRTAVIPTPVYADGHVFVTAGYGVGCKLIDVRGGKAKEVYFNKNMKNHHGGVLYLDGKIYGYSDGGGWMCLDFMTGKITWNERRALAKGAVTYADGRLYCLGERNGTVVLAGASPDGWEEFGRFVLEPKSKIRSPRGRIWTHPVVCNGKLYLRDQEYIYCYDVSGP